MEFKVVKNFSEIPTDGIFVSIAPTQTQRKTTQFQGREYEVLCTKEKPLSYLEYTGRIFLGTVMTVFSLGIALLFDFTRDLFTKKAFQVQFLLEPCENITKTSESALKTLFPTNQLSTSEIENTWSFLDSFFNEYENTFNQNNVFWKTKNPSSFLHAELNLIITETNTLIKALDELIVQSQTNLQIDEEKTHQQLKMRFLELQAKANQLLLKLPPNQNCVRKVTGIQNAGNTCYINAALQPLFAIQHFESLIPDTITQLPGEEESVFIGRQSILASLKAVLQARKDNSSDPSKLGHLVGELRTAIFKAQLNQGDFVWTEGEKSYQDAGSFFTLILSLIRQGTVLFFTSQEGSIEEKIQTYHENNAEAIQDSSPELLIFWVNSYQVKPQDFSVDCQALFPSNQASDESRYELVGFSQNQNQAHWVSTVREGDHWVNCNDANTQTAPVDSQLFQYPANYLVYKKT